MPQATPPAAPELLGSLLAAPVRADLDSIAQCFVQLAGGPGSIAKMLYDEYSAAEPGTPVRARIMEMMLRAFTKLDSKAIPEDLSELDDAELDRIMKQQLEVCTRTTRGHSRSATAAGPEKAKDEGVKISDDAAAAQYAADSAAGESAGAGNPSQA